MTNELETKPPLGASLLFFTFFPEARVFFVFLTCAYGAGAGGPSF